MALTAMVSSFFESGVSRKKAPETTPALFSTTSGWPSFAFTCSATA